MKPGSRGEIERAIARATGLPFKIERCSSVGGGCINAAFTLEGNGGRYFVKTNEAACAEMFAAEAAGPEELERSGSVRVPHVICHGSDSEAAWIAIEYIDMRRRTAASDRLLGQQLARMHRCTSDRFGWHRDNTIGSTPQSNARTAEWPAFWRDERLGRQLEIARGRGYGGRLQSNGERLSARMSEFFSTYAPQPSLLHGDLWSGNAASDPADRPVIFDPAVYYGDREADIAMAELFGGYAASFYDAYRAAYPLDRGYAVRKDLYNLYHVLNHLNLFGAGYLEQAERLIARLLSET
ncbi:MAG: fructosamine kinase family protein [Burkholderiales bacterium]